jgi:diguanylate cyclase (GGDEF)-like protein
MPLHIPTLMVMGSFVAICSGSILLGSWLLNQRTPVLGLWGSAGILYGGGIFMLMLGLVTRDPRFLGLGNIMIALGHGLMWKGARAFDNKAASPVIAFLGGLMLALATMPNLPQTLQAQFGLLINAVYIFAAAFAIWSARKPPLPARWPIVAMITVHAAVMLTGAISLFNGAPEQGPSLMSAFGVIHFESIAFSVGTAVGLVALVKSRREVAAKQSADIDSLTGIANRAAFMARAEIVLAHCRHDRAPVSVVMFDLDGFKSINDTHGHAAGDAVIRRFSDVAAAAIRHNDVIGRIGGEEFALILGRSSAEPALMRADRIRAAFSESCRSIHDGQIKATVSGGVATSNTAETTLAALLEEADQALYRAKAAGRNRIRSAGQIVKDDAKPHLTRAA